MASDANPAFDPYYKWLGIPPDEQPPNYYRLLAVGTFEENPDVIEAAASQRIRHLRNGGVAFNTIYI